MDISQLIHELKLGIRLPSPTFCPKPIATLMKQCFHADPKERPDFSKIKSELEAEYKDMNARTILNSNGEGNETTPLYVTLLNEMTDNTMRSRYSAVIKGNLKYDKAECVSGKEETSIEFDKRLSIVKYASLEHVRSRSSP